MDPNPGLNQISTSNRMSYKCVGSNVPNSNENAQKISNAKETKASRNVSVDVNKLKLTPKPAIISSFNIDGKKYSPRNMTLHQQHGHHQRQLLLREQQHQHKEQHQLQHENQLQQQHQLQEQQRHLQQEKEQHQCPKSHAVKGSLSLAKILTKQGSEAQKPKAWPTSKVEVIKTDPTLQKLSQSYILNGVKESNLRSTRYKPKDSKSSFNGTKWQDSRTVKSTNPKRFPCKYCSFVSRTPCQQEFHVFYNHLSAQEKRNEADYKCEICDFSEFAKDVFLKHLKSHQQLSSSRNPDSSQILCLSQDLQSAQSLDLSQDLQSTQDLNLQKNLKSSQILNKPKIEERISALNYNFVDSPKQSQLEDNGETLFINDLTIDHHDLLCPKCDFKCQERKEFEIHFKEFHEDRVVEDRSLAKVCPCPYCPFKASDKRRLLYHAKFYCPARNQKTNKCPYCDFRSRFSTKFISHLNNKHPGKLN